MGILKWMKKSSVDTLGFFKRKKLLSIFLVLLFLFAAYLSVFFISLPDVRNLREGVPSTTSLISQRIEENTGKGKTFRVRKNWVPFSAIPLLLKRTAIVSEDIGFYDHHGIDYYELKESIKINLSTGKSSRGGSTITQQLAKNLFLTTGKSYIRKVKEFFIAKRLEKHLSKNRILELYLNVIEFGHGVFGVGTASEVFFNKHVSTLSDTEIIRLICVLPKPLRVTPLSNSDYLKWRANLLLKRLYGRKFISEESYIGLSENFR